MADDLSGAADCAAAFAAAFVPIAVVLGEVTPARGSAAIDTDSRAMPVEAAMAAVSRAFVGIPPSGEGALVYKKIDSTLRGHVAAELRAALDAAPQFAGAVVAPSFPEQGRTLNGGKLYLDGNAVEEPAADLMATLVAAGLKPALLQQPRGDPARIRQQIEQALARGARAVVVDATGPDTLARLGAALLDPAAGRWLLAGSAGLARALARQLSGPRSVPVMQPAGGPVLALVGSFSPASAAQVRQIEDWGAARVIRLGGAQWLAPQGPLEAVAQAHEALRGGRHVVLAISGPVVPPFTREPVRAMARAATGLLRDARTCVLTGGDTARALFDELGVRQLDVMGEFEPGISMARDALQGERVFVLKAGGFGDAEALRRIMGYFGGSQCAAMAREPASS